MENIDDLGLCRMSRREPEWARARNKSILRASAVIEATMQSKQYVWDCFNYCTKNEVISIM